MLPAFDFSLKRTPAHRSRSQVLRDGVPTGLEIDGVWIERQFAVPDGTVLMVVDDALLEDALLIYLLDHTPRVVDRVELRRMYGNGSLAAVQTHGERELRFSYFPGDTWRLDVLRRPVLGLHLPWPYRDLHRPQLLAKRWLRLTRA